MSELREKAVNGMLWKAADKFGGKLIQFVIGIIIARVLSPDDFGIIGMLMLFISLSDIILDSGFANALIQKQDRTDEDYSTAFYFNVVVGFSLYGLLWICAPFIADFYNMPILCGVARCYSLCLVLNSLSIVQTAKLSVELNFKLQSIASLSAVGVSSIVGVWMAYNGYGVWSLVAQGVSSQTVRLVILWLTSHWTPKMVFSMESLGYLWGFGSKLLCSGIINAIYNNLYSLVIGKVFRATEVGYYHRSTQFVDLPTGTFTSVVMSVNYPILARLQNDNEALKRAYMKCLRAPLFILYPFLMTLAVLAEPIVVALIGEKWLPCVPLLQIMCLGSMWNPLTTINLNLLYVKGRTDIVLKLEFIKKPIAFLILFSMMSFGVMWLCVGRAMYDFIAFCFNCYYTKKFLQYGFWQQVKALLPIHMYCVIAALAMYVAKESFSFSNVWFELCSVVSIGIVVYLLASYLNKDESFGDFVGLLREKLRMKRV